VYSIETMNRKNYLLFILLICAQIYPADHRKVTIMLDPAGDARETGRIIEDSLERAVTIQFAQQLRDVLTSQLPNSTVIITRTPGEELQPLQQANFANRLPVDLYLNINMVHAPHHKPTLQIYQFSLGDTFVAPSQGLAMIPYDRAHQKSASQTTKYGTRIISFLSNKDHNKFFMVEPLYQLPFAPLMGIQAPALGLEMSIPSKTAWKEFVNPIAQSIAFALEQ